MSLPQNKKIIKLDLGNSKKGLNPVHFLLVLQISLPAPFKIGLFALYVLLVAIVVSSLFHVQAPFEL